MLLSHRHGHHQRVCRVIGSFFESIFGTDAQTAPRQGPREGGGGVELPTRRRQGGPPAGGAGGGAAAYGGLVEPSEANISNLMVSTSVSHWPPYCLPLYVIVALTFIHAGPGV
jgi:hypothetical protein